MKRKFCNGSRRSGDGAWLVGVSLLLQRALLFPASLAVPTPLLPLLLLLPDDASETTKVVYKTIVSTEGNTEEKLAAVVGEETVAQAAAVAGVETVEDLSIRAVGDVNVDSKTGEVAVTVTGMEDGDTAVVLYQDANGNWVAIKAVVVNGKLTFKMPKSGTIILLTNKA